MRSCELFFLSLLPLVCSPCQAQVRILHSRFTWSIWRCYYISVIICLASFVGIGHAALPNYDPAEPRVGCVLAFPDMRLALFPLARPQSQLSTQLIEGTATRAKEQKTVRHSQTGGTTGREGSVTGWDWKQPAGLFTASREERGLYITCRYTSGNGYCILSLLVFI